MVFVEMDMTTTVETYRHLDHEVLIDSSLHREAARWCETQFGRRWEATGNRSGRWNMFWAGPGFGFPGQYRFCFAREQDMMMFILRWTK
jgi:hypothetical protein